MRCARTRVCSDHLWLDLTNLYPTAFITNHTTIHLLHPLAFSNIYLTLTLTDLLVLTVESHSSMQYSFTMGCT